MPAVFGSTSYGPWAECSRDPQALGKFPPASLGGWLCYHLPKAHQGSFRLLPPRLALCWIFMDTPLAAPAPQKLSGGSCAARRLWPHRPTIVSPETESFLQMQPHTITMLQKKNDSGLVLSLWIDRGCRQETSNAVLFPADVFQGKDKTHVTAALISPLGTGASLFWFCGIQEMGSFTTCL